MEKVLIELDIIKKMHTADGIQTLEGKLSIVENQLVTLFGKSGVGKTTLLRMIAGLTTPDEGYIKVDDVPWFDSAARINRKPQLRSIGLVFQDYALFPNMTVKQHLLYAQPEKDLGYVAELLEIFELEGLSGRKPDTLSGGQKQRLAVARALARKPRILLLDEPLSALDGETRTMLQEEIILAHKSFHATTILVSHDVAEVQRLSDQIYIVENGGVSKANSMDALAAGSCIMGETEIAAEIFAVSGNDVTIKLNGSPVVLAVNSDTASKLKPGDMVTITLSGSGIKIKE